MFNPSGLLNAQKDHANFCLDSLNRNGYYLDFSQTGTGKTFVTSSVCANANLPAYVICPRAVKYKWAEVLGKFGVSSGLVINYELLARGNTAYMKFAKQRDPMDPDATKATVELPEFRIPKNSLVILDEGQRCKATDSINSYMLWALVKQGYKVAYVSATSACSPVEMKSLGYLAGMHNFYNFRDFCLANGAGSNKFGAFTWDGDSTKAKQAMVAIHNYLFTEKRCASRLTRDMFSDFPESQIVADALDMGPASKLIDAAYEEMEAELALLEEHTSGYSDHVFAIIMKARRQVELFKIPTLVQLIEDAVDSGESPVCFLNFTESIGILASRLKKSLQSLVSFIVGGQSDAERTANIKAFQSDKKRIAIANMAAGGVAVDLHDVNGKFPRQAFLSPNWSAQLILQALGRVWRAGGKSKSHQRLLYAAGTIEDRCARAAHFKINNIESLNDGDLAVSPFELSNGNVLTEKFQSSNM